jgi:hypothetical protein
MLHAADISFSGYLDSDMWSDFSGNLYTNDELDLATNISFTDNVDAHVYTTVATGSVPAGSGEPGQRWAAVAFDGVDVTIATPKGTIGVGDLVYQYGGFDYYLYKRLSMVTPESFLRGVSYAIETDRLSQTVLLGVGDAPNTVYSYNVAAIGGDTISVAGDSVATDRNQATIAGETGIGVGESYTLRLYASVHSDITARFEDTGMLSLGSRLEGRLAELLSFHTTVGFMAGPSQSRGLTLLIEPALSLEKYSLAASVYSFFDLEDGAALNPVNDEFFVYIEPGIQLATPFALGLPLEIHTPDMSALDTEGEFWGVPTMYIYPSDGVQWWLWAQAIVPFDADRDLAYAVGSEIIVEF